MTLDKESRRIVLDAKHVGPGGAGRQLCRRVAMFGICAEGKGVGLGVRGGVESFWVGRRAGWLLRVL